MKGVTAKGFVTFHRPDGLKQQAIDGWPLYAFSGDAKPGDTNGQGVGGTWYAVSPDAKLVGAPKWPRNSRSGHRPVAECHR